MKFVDTNFFIRLFAEDDERKTRACKRFLQAVQQGHDEITISESIFSEIAYVLSSSDLYGLSNSETAARMAPVLATRGLHVPNRRTYSRALEIFSGNQRLDIEDALSVAHMERLGITEIVSYDRDFDRLPGVTRVEP